MSGPYTPAFCDTCEQYTEKFCDMYGVCQECCNECKEGDTCE